MANRSLRLPYAALALTASLLSSASLCSQTLAQQTQRAATSIDGPSRVISANPFLPLLGYFAAEFEQRIQPAVAIALAASHIKPDRTRYTNVDLKARLYPSELALNGFNFAASLGMARIAGASDADCVQPTGTPTCGVAPKPFTTASFAVELGYQWLLGPSRVTAVTVGGGAKRYLGAESKFDLVDRVVPTLRLSIGYAF